MRFLLAAFLPLAFAANLGCAARSSPIASSPSAPGDWAQVLGTPVGTEVRIEDGSGRRVTGRVSRVDPDVIVVGPVAHTVAHNRADIRRVFVISRPPHSIRNGFLVGVAIGALQGALLTRSNRAAFAGMFGAAWGAIGSCIGAIRRFDVEETLIYQGTTP